MSIFLKIRGNPGQPSHVGGVGDQHGCASVLQGGLYTSDALLQQLYGSRHNQYLRCLVRRSNWDFGTAIASIVSREEKGGNCSVALCRTVSAIYCRWKLRCAGVPAPFRRSELNSKTRSTVHIALWTGVIVLFFALRLLHASQILVAPPGRILIIDSRFYYEWAQKIIEGHGMGGTVFFMSPLYPLFLALGASISSYDILAAVMLQVLLSLGTLALIARFTHRRFGRAAALAAGTVYALYAPSIYYDGILVSASLILFLTMAAITFLDLAEEENRLTWVIAAGLAIGLSALTRPNALILLPAFAVVMMVRWKRFGWERAAVMIVAAVITVFPAALHNYLHGGEWYLTTNSAGVNYYIGNHSRATGTYQEVPWLSSAEPEYEAADYRREAERQLNRGLTVGEASRYWFREGLRWNFSHPVEWLLLMGKKTLYFLNRIEAPNNVSFRGVREYSQVLRLLGWLNFGLIAPFGLAGLLFARRETGWGIAVALVLAYLLASLLFFVAGEYRYPVIGVLIAYGAGISVRSIARMRERQVLSVQYVMMAVLLGLFLSNLPLPHMKRLASPRMDYFNWASVSFAKGDLANASLLFTAALAWDPTWREAQIQLAQVYDEMGMKELADREYAAAGITREELEDARRQQEFHAALPDSLRGTELSRISPEQLATVGIRFVRLQKLRQAKIILQHAVSRDTSLMDARFHLAYALEKTGYYEPALEEYYALEQILDDDPMIPYRIAWTYFAEGNRGSARAGLRRTEKKARDLADKESRERWLKRVEEAEHAFMNF
ncbi:hypothetical protein GF324_02415 [bacterium]|nr:hypothetical protein [bacterium]